MSHVRNEVTDEFLQLRKVDGHVILVELGVWVVLHVLRHGKLEVRVCTELFAHLLNKFFDLTQLVLNTSDLAQLAFVFLLGLFNLLLERGLSVLFLLL